MKYPLNVNDNVVRAVASVTFSTAFAILLRPEFAWLIIPLFADFALRYIHPRLSPLAMFTKWISETVMKVPSKLIFSPPKRFAMLIGMILTGGMVVSYVFGFSMIFNVLLVFLLIASNLQAWFDFCLGCEIYDILMKFGIVGRKKTADAFLKEMNRLNHSTQKITNLTDRNYISKALRAEVNNKGELTNRENDLILELTNDLDAYVKILQLALDDGHISQTERDRLFKGRNIISKRAFELANSDQMISEVDNTVLGSFRELLYQLVKVEESSIPYLVSKNNRA